MTFILRMRKLNPKCDYYVETHTIGKIELYLYVLEVLTKVFKYKVYKLIIYIIYILSVYSPFSDRMDFLIIAFTLLLHLLLSWTSSLSISSSAISASTLTTVSNNVFLGLPTGLLPSTLYSIHFISLHPVLITCPYHLSLPLLMKVVIYSTTPTSLLNSSFVILSFNKIPHIHLIICISTLSNFNLTSTSKGLVSLP